MRTHGKSPRAFVAFALDHVLYDDRPALAQYAANASAFLTEHGVAHDPDDIKGYQTQLRSNHGELPGAVLFSLEFSVSVADISKQLYMSIDLVAAGVPSSREDRAATLQALDAYKVVWSSVPGAYASKVVCQLGLAAHFHEIIGCETITSIKSEARAFAQISERFPDYDEYWLVDSSPDNIRCASDSGWRNITFVGDSATDTIGTGAVHPANGRSIERFDQLLPIINGA